MSYTILGTDLSFSDVQEALDFCVEHGWSTLDVIDEDLLEESIDDDFELYDICRGDD